MLALYQFDVSAVSIGKGESNVSFTMVLDGWAIHAGCSHIMGQELRPDRGVAQLIELLGSETYELRQRAHDQLLHLAETAADEILQATSHPDLEVRQRAKMIWSRLQEDRLWRGSVVALPHGRLPASEALTILGNQIDTPFRYTENFRDTDIALSSTSTSFWYALDEICRQGGFTAIKDRDAFRIAQATPRREPTSFVGPLRARVVTADRDFRETFNYSSGLSKRIHTVTFNLLIDWEPRFDLLASRSEMQVKAMNGEEFAFSGDEISSDWRVVSGRESHVSYTVCINRMVHLFTTLDQLELQVRFLAAGDHQVLHLTSLEKDAAYFQDDVRVRIESVPQSNGGFGKVVVLYERDWPQGYSPDLCKTEPLIEVFDLNGDLWGTSKTNTWPSIAEGVVTYRIDSTGDEEGLEPFTARVTYPMLYSERDITFVFNDLPLPSQQP